MGRAQWWWMVGGWFLGGWRCFTAYCPLLLCCSAVLLPADVTEPPGLRANLLSGAKRLACCLLRTPRAVTGPPSALAVPNNSGA
jgi:hypothetical protein